jgi:competence protein ComEC
VKLPALWLALAFAAGIAAGAGVTRGVTLWVVACLIAIAAGICLSLFARHSLVVGSLALAAWFTLGGAAAQLERNDVPQNDVATQIAHGALDTKEPLRWLGRMREDPEATPLGWRYTIDLQSVEETGRTLPVHGGLRLTYYRSSDNENPPALRAGDTIEALSRVRIPRNYMDPGAFDERAYLARQGIELLGELRSVELIHVVGSSKPSLAERFARFRGNLLGKLDTLFAGKPAQVSVLRAMLLGDRNFINSDVAETFQKTAAFHVLVLAGLHVGTLAFFVFWLGRVLRLPLTCTTFLTLAALAAYLAIVQDRPPILRAALMTAIFLCARLFFRRVALLNTVGLAAIILLAARPSDLCQSSFRLSFLAAGVIAGLAIPWIDRSSAPYRRALEHLSDVTRDRLHSPRATQFRLDLRYAAAAMAKRVPESIAPHVESFFTLPVRFGLRVWEIFLLSFCIQLGMAPLLALYFHRVSISGPVSNVFAVPLVGIIVPFGFLALALSYVSSVLGSILAKIESVFVGCLLATMRWFGALPRASWRIPGPPAWLLVAFFITLACLAAMAWSAAENRTQQNVRVPLPKRTFVPERIALLSLLALAALVSIHPFAPTLEKSKLEATVLDVGQGDSIFIAFPDGRTMLIDGGGLSGTEHISGYQTGFDVGEQVVSPYLWSLGLKKLDVVLLTHADHDHIDGLHAVLDNFHVGQLWVGRDEDRLAYRRLLAEARTHGVAIVHVAQGTNFDWDGTDGKILWPSAADTSGDAPEGANNESVVLRIGDGPFHFLLTGDAERQVEDALIEEHQPLQSDFLKVPHHGSKTSSTAEFLDAVMPRVAVASLGEDNLYGHPNPATVQRYAAKGIPLFRTDINGAVAVSTDGHTLLTRAFASSGAH